MFLESSTKLLGRQASAQLHLNWLYWLIRIRIGINAFYGYRVDRGCELINSSTTVRNSAADPHCQENSECQQQQEMKQLNAGEGAVIKY